MIKYGGLSFETQLKIEFLPPNNGSKKWLEKSLAFDYFLYILKRLHTWLKGYIS